MPAAKTGMFIVDTSLEIAAAVAGRRAGDPTFIWRSACVHARGASAGHTHLAPISVRWTRPKQSLRTAEG